MGTRIGWQSISRWQNCYLCHTPTADFQPAEKKMHIYHRGQWIGIDCGCAYLEEGGQLACLRLDDCMCSIPMRDAQNFAV